MKHVAYQINEVFGLEALLTCFIQDIRNRVLGDMLEEFTLARLTKKPRPIVRGYRIFIFPHRRRAVYHGEQNTLNLLGSVEYIFSTLVAAPHVRAAFTKRTVYLRYLHSQHGAPSVCLPTTGNVDSLDCM